MKLLFDYLPLIVFAGTYYLSNIYTATAVLMVSLVLVVVGYWLVKREIHKVHLATAVLALIFGGLTLAVHDPLFIKIKPSVLYALFAIVLAGSNVIGDRPLIQRALDGQLELPDPVWRRLSLMWAGFFAFCGVLNLYVAFAYSETVWVNFKLFGMTGMSLIFGLLTGLYLYQYITDES